MKRNRLVKSQKDRVIHSTETYWDQVAKNLIDDEISESPLANPDILSEEEGFYSKLANSIDFELVEAIKKHANKSLTEKEKFVFFNLVDGKTVQETAELLRTTTKTVNTYLFRARTKLKSFVIKYHS